MSNAKSQKLALTCAFVMVGGLDKVFQVDMTAVPRYHLANEIRPGRLVRKQPIATAEYSNALSAASSEASSALDFSKRLSTFFSET